MQRKNQKKKIQRMSGLSLSTINQSINQSSESGSNSNSLEKAFNQHFHIKEMEDEELIEMLQDSIITENKLSSTAA